MNQTKTTSQIIPKVLAGLPAQNSEKLESPLSNTTPQPLSNCNKSSCESNLSKKLRTGWQQVRLGFDAGVPGAQEMADAVETWCMNFARCGAAGRVIILSGPFGCGKTRSLKSAKRYVRDRRMEVWPQAWQTANPPQYHGVNWADFIRELTERENPEAREDMMTSDVVFWDDIGSEEDRFRSGSPTRILGDCLGWVHDQNKFAFITTNIAPAGWQERWDGRVEDRLLRSRAIVVDLWRHQAESYAVWKLKNP